MTCTLDSDPLRSVFSSVVFGRMAVRFSPILVLEGEE